MKGTNGIGLMDSAVKVAAGYYHSIVLREDGTVWSTGLNTDGQLGINSVSTWNYPQQVKDVYGSGYLSDIIDIDAGSHHNMALSSDGKVWFWGDNQYLPIQISGIPFISKIVCGGSQNLALDTNGTIWAWGGNNYGQVGTNTYTTQSIPAQVWDPSGIGVLDSVIKIGAGGMHSFALTSDDKAFSWGRNSQGQLGVNTTIDSYIPIQIHGIDGVEMLSDVAEITGGQLHSIARLNSGELIVWGSNSTNQLGLGSYEDKKVPTLIEYCEDIALTIEKNEAADETKILLYPNPVQLNGSLTLDINSGDDKEITITIYSIQGQIIWQSMDNNGKGNTVYSIPTDRLSSGTYFVTISNSSISKSKMLIVQ